MENKPSEPIYWNNSHLALEAARTAMDQRAHLETKQVNSGRKISEIHGQDCQGEAVICRSVVVHPALGEFLEEITDSPLIDRHLSEVLTSLGSLSPQRDYLRDVCLAVRRIHVLHIPCRDTRFTWNLPARSCMSLPVFSPTANRPAGIGRVSSHQTSNTFSIKRLM